MKSGARRTLREVFASVVSAIQNMLLGTAFAGERKSSATIKDGMMCARVMRASRCTCGFPAIYDLRIRHNRNDSAGSFAF